MSILLLALASALGRSSPTAAASNAQDPSFTVAKLPSTLTYGGGYWEFSPPSLAVQTVSAEAALASFASTGVYAYASDYDTPTLQLASFTNYGEGTVDTDGSLDLANEHRLVWLIVYHNVPDAPSVGALPEQIDSAGGTGAREDEIELHDILGIVDASTGQPLDAISSLPD